MTSPQRSSIRRAVGCLLAAAALLGLAHVALLPPWEGFDEEAHYSILQQLVDERAVPERNGARISRDVGDYAAQYECPRPKLRPETMRQMLEYSWPGNVRELENWVKRIVVLQSDDWVQQAVASASSKRERTALVAAPEAPAPQNGAAPVVESVAGLKEIGRRAALQAEAQALREVLDSVHWHRLEAARRLKVSYKTLLQKMKQTGL